MPPPDPHVLVVQQLFVRHQPKVRAFVQAFLADGGVADDVIQEVFLTVTLKAGDFREGTNFLEIGRAHV